MTPRSDCPGCGGAGLSAPWVSPNQPVVLNYRFRDAAAAGDVARRDVTLVQCPACGLVFNATFDPGAIPYDENYENRQCFSEAFEAHLEALAGGLIERHALSGGRILEVGCGKGDFLRRLCRAARASGDGYDTSFEPGAAPEPDGVTFHRRYVAPADVTVPYDAVICRHVVEHVPEIGSFLGELAGIARAAGDPVVVVETPRWEWIVEQLSLWDVFYEHCNYFSESALAHLCRRAGFRVARQRAVFGGQYQLLELRLARTRRAAPPPGIPEGARLSDFALRARRALERVERDVAAAAAGGDWGVWGAGAKGVALVNQIQGPPPSLVVDSNPAKQGGVLSGTRVPIVAPGDPRVARLSLVLIANPNYAGEIRAALARNGFSGRTLTL